MTTQEVADKFIQNWLNDNIENSIEELYLGNDQHNIPQFLITRTKDGSIGMLKESRYAAVPIEKFGGIEISEPLIIDHIFCFSLKIKVIVTDIGEHILRESWVFEVRDGRIVKEKFYYCIGNEEMNIEDYKNI